LTDSSGHRTLTTRLKNARQRTLSSQRWLERQLNDPYVERARREGYRSRAAFKLIEIDDAHHILKPGLRVLDLGAAPGGWSQVARARTNATVVALDLLPIDPIPGVITLQGDFLDLEAPARMREALGGKDGGAADVVLSDMAANSTGHKKTDHLKIMGLVEEAIAFAEEVLAPNGHFLAKVLQGGTEAALLVHLKQHFRTVKHIKPKASRSDSSEMYVLAMGYRA
jgi:23S rRNA (uridine2552-2'-O)-methyltransferase